MAILDAEVSNSVVGKPSFPLRHRALRGIWNVTWKVLASWTPPPLYPWRRFLLRLFGARIDPTARVYGSARIWYPPNLVMGKHTVLAWEALCYNQAMVQLEDYAIVSQRSHLCTGTHDIDDPNFQLIAKPITIERHGWVASDAFVGPGVRVGEGAVLGGRGVAFKDLEPWTVYGGNPCREIRKRKMIAGAWS
ncbi:LbetaH domain-containing protein [Ancylobacter terrae]|uniref:putative colanic acid biosynthesis acetyltransferase n=1 Tax=Ancylobacter sp. sgz301288 TaxID=3342077 RepID=UPI00385F2841